MCGIYLSNIPFSKKEVSAKLDSIGYRGPDHMGIEHLDDLFFGHLRLSILDLDDRSNQPMHFGEFTIVFNGEIYNYLQIRDELIRLGHVFNTSGDTEVLLKGYKEWGSEIVPKLNGMFAFAIYDSKKHKIFCSRDRLGVKPLYYSWFDGAFEICSQIRPISKDRTINEDAISIYLDCAYIPSPLTIYNNVFKLSPGNNLEIDLKNKTKEIKEYWNLKAVSEGNIPYHQAKETLHELLKDAVKIRLQSDVPFGTFLSGGIDSALISSIASRVSKSPIKTFSIGFEDPNYDESIIASKYAEFIGSVHTETICKSEDVLELIPKLIKVYDEPFGDSSALPSLLLSKITKNYVTMALSGDGGDESFLGYNSFDWIRKNIMLTKIPYILRLLLSKIFVLNIFGAKTKPLRQIFSLRTNWDFIIGIFVGYISIVKKRNLNWFLRYKGFDFGSQNLYQATADLNIKLWLENDSNVKVDRASMAYSLEVRSPFLDYRIIEFARTLPVSYRYVPGIKKRILRDILKEYIPEDIFNQPKRGFAVPIGKWIRTELRSEFINNLSDDFLNLVPNLDVPTFKRMFRLHLEGKHDYSSHIWRVYVLSKWYQEFGFYKNANFEER